MKKLLRGTVSWVLAASITITSLGGVQIVYGEDGWIQGWTGKEGSVNYTVTDENGIITLENTKVNNGKFTDGEDSIIYYASKLDSDYDFELKALVSIDEYSVMEESSNPQQGSVGIGVLDELYNKTDDKAFTDSVFVGTWAENKSNDLTFRPIVRDNSEAKTIGDALSDGIKNSGTELGEYELSITKSGNAYTLSCGENSTTVEVNNMEEEVYPCLYIARNAKATFSNVSLTVETKKVTALEVSGEAKSVYHYGDELDLRGLTVTAAYDDESKEVITDYLVKGYSPKKIGKQKVKILKGSAVATIDVEVKKLAVTDIIVNSEPVKTDYYTATALDTTGLEVTAIYDDGTQEVLPEGQYTIKIGGKAYKNGDLLSEKLKSTENVIISRLETAGISKGSATGVFNIEVTEQAIESLEVTPPVKRLYYIGDEVNLAGMKVEGIYADSLGNSGKEMLSDAEYTISGFDSTKAGTCTVRVTSKSNSAVIADFDVEVHQRAVTGIKVTKYPRTTYNIGEEFDNKDMEVSLVYDNGDIEPVSEGIVVDTGAFDTSVVGECSVKLAVGGYSPVELKITVQDKKDIKWKKTVFGQSSGYDKQEQGNVAVKPEMEGTVNGTINMRSWEGSGKITNDHDGMAYYYTSIDAGNNFKVSADIKVNKYLEHDNDDTKRNGQEAFGIMARDVIPLQSADGSMVTDETLATKDADNMANPQENSSVFASNIALLGGYSGTGYEKAPEANRINLLIRTGVEAVDGGGTRVGPFAVNGSCPKEGDSYRLTLQRVNGGVYASCYDYATGEMKDTYYYDDEFLKVQSDDKIYVGFFTSRWADIDVSNVEFYETSRVTDQNIEVEEDNTKTADIEINSGSFTDSSAYVLDIKPVDSTGRVTVKQNKTIIAKDQEIGKEGLQIDTKLYDNSKNDFTVLYTPDDTLELSSYEPIIIRKSVIQKDFDKNAKEVYVSNEGSYKGDGTVNKPYDIDTAIGFAAAGQTIVLQEGTYKRTTPIIIEKGNDGKNGNYKTIKAEDGKKVVLDFSGVSAGAVVTGNYWRFEGIDFTNCGDNQKCFHLGGSNCIIKNCKFYNNRDMGLQISRTYGTDDKSLWPSNNLIEGCESYNNCDPSMINADGFGAKLTVGEGNKFVNCESHHNVDDGWDLYTKVNSGAIGAVTLENCKSYRNGWRLNEDGTETEYGAGGHNGFKLGGENVAVMHKLVNCVAYGNGNNGVTTNSNPTLSLENVISYDNLGCNFRLYSDKPEEYNYEVKNIVSYNPGNFDVFGTVNEDEEYENANPLPIVSDDNYITWDLKTGSVNADGEKATENMLNK